MSKKLDAIEGILNSKKAIFYSEISNDKNVTQNIADAEEHFKWLVEQAELLNSIRELINFKLLTKAEIVDKISELIN